MIYSMLSSHLNKWNISSFPLINDMSLKSCFCHFNVLKMFKNSKFMGWERASCPHMYAYSPRETRMPSNMYTEGQFCSWPHKVSISSILEYHIFLNIPILSADKFGNSCHLGWLIKIFTIFFCISSEMVLLSSAYFAFSVLNNLNTSFFLKYTNHVCPRLYSNPTGGPEA